MAKYLISTAVVALMVTPLSATILTFDDNDGTTNAEGISQAYGDNVSTAANAEGTYGVGAEGFTPNVTLSYGQGAELPLLWTTGYNELTNVLYVEPDGITTFTLNFVADTGFVVDLFDFDLGNFGGAVTLQNVQVFGDDGTELYASGPVMVPGAGGSSISFAPNVSSSSLTLFLDLTGLGGNSDNMGLDNIRFGQAADLLPEPVPAPAGLGLLGLAIFGLAGLRRIHG